MAVCCCNVEARDGAYVVGVDPSAEAFKVPQTWVWLHAASAVAADQCLLLASSGSGRGVAES